MPFRFLPRFSLSGVVGGGAAGFAWDPSFSTSDIAFSNGNQTATDNLNTSWRTVRGLVSKSTGKWYFEIKCNSVGSDNEIGLTGNTLGNTAYVGSTSDSWGQYSGGSNYHGASGTTVGPTFATGDIVMVAWDAGGGLLYYGKNGTFTGSPTAGTGAVATNVIGTFYPAISMNQSGNQYTIQNTLSYAIPSGYSQWQ